MHAAGKIRRLLRLPWIAAGVFTVSSVLLGLAAGALHAEPWPPPSGLAVATFATSAWIKWDPYPGDITGFILYRSLPGGPAVPIGRAVAGETGFTDCGLAPGVTYRYAISALYRTGEETPLSPPVEAATHPYAAAYLRIPSLSVLCPIYTAGMERGEPAAIRAGLELARMFYWRNSRCRLDLRLVPVLIDAPAPPTEGGTYVYLEEDLRSRGVEDNQYDAVFTVGDGLDGCWGGFIVLGLTGAAYGRECGVPYPGGDPAVDYGITWTFTHEFGHVLDLVIAELSGHHQMLFNHFPWIYPLPEGELFDAGPHYDGMSDVLRRFDRYDGFIPPWNGYVEVIDADGDSLPDDDPRVAMDELRWGSLSSRRDSDLDGLDDRDELAAGIYTASHPRITDSDGDGLRDGEDPFPLSTLSPWVAYAFSPPLIDGFLEPQWSLMTTDVYYARDPDLRASLYGLWDEGHLYLALLSNRELRVYVSLDGSGENGRFQTAGAFAGSGQTVESTWGDCWGDGSHLWTSFGYTDIFAGLSRVSGSQVGSATDGEVYIIEMAIPHTLPRGANYCYAAPGTPEISGLTFDEGGLLGLALTVGEVGTGATRAEFTGEWAALFEPYRFYDVTLVTGTPVAATARPPMPRRLEFWPVVPNPVAGPAYMRFALPPAEEGGESTVPVELTLFDVLGRRTRTLLARDMLAGVHELRWDGRDARGEPAASGVYYARLMVGGDVITQKVIVLR